MISDSNKRVPGIESDSKKQSPVALFDIKIHVPGLIIDSAVVCHFYRQK